MAHNEACHRDVARREQEPQFVDLDRGVLQCFAVRLSLLKAEEKPLPDDVKRTVDPKGKKGKPILLPLCIEPVLIYNLSQAPQSLFLIP